MKPIGKDTKIINLARNWRGFLLDLLFPKQCASCGITGYWLCPECVSIFPAYKDGRCIICRSALPSGNICFDCSASAGLDTVDITSDFKSTAVKRSINRFKFSFVKDLAGPLGEIMVKRVRADKKNPWINGAFYTNGEQSLPVLIPVPLHKRRLRWRGFNQSELLGEIIADKLGLKMDTNILVRIKYFRPQAKLNETDRQKNISGAFKVANENLKNKNILLVDDIATSGATLSECARILKAAGANKVHALVLAKG